MILKKSENISIKKTVDMLQKNNIVIIPTDTVYGFSGLVPTTDSKIRYIKGREETKPFIQLISAPDDILSLTDSIIPQKLLDLWPGALTLIVKNLHDKGTTAYRCPGDAWLRAIISQCKCPLYSTSVNRSGMPILDTIDSIVAEFSQEVSLIIDDGNKKNALPSTIIDVTNATIKILRQGSVKI
jgi:L-threonylcarbamoyladenylate synthase